MPDEPRATPERAVGDPSGECLLTLVFPAALEEAIVGHLLEHPEWASGFTCIHVEGHGRSVPLRGSAELVRGRSKRLMAQIVISNGECRRLLDHFRETVPNPEVVFWTVPLAAYGRLTAAGTGT